MSYLFWSFAIVWIALFVYVRVLMRRTRALEDEVRRLGGGGRGAA
jgi:CcmD family protein